MWRFRLFIDEALGIGPKGLFEEFEDRLASGMNFVSLSAMHLVRRHQANAQMMIAIGPVENMTAKDVGVLDGAEPFWQLRLAFHSLEVAF